MSKEELKVRKVSKNYSVNAAGDVFTVRRQGSQGGKMKQLETRDGYMGVMIYIEKRPQRMLVHRLIASAFIENPENKPQVNHLDGNKKNNRKDNLEWVTAKENIAHAWVNNMYVKGENHHLSRLTTSDINEIKQLRSGGMYQCEIAKIFSVGPDHISRIVNNKVRTDG